MQARLLAGINASAGTSARDRPHEFAGFTTSSLQRTDSSVAALLHNAPGGGSEAAAGQDDRRPGTPTFGQLGSLSIACADAAHGAAEGNAAAMRGAGPSGYGGACTGYSPAGPRAQATGRPANAAGPSNVPPEAIVGVPAVGTGPTIRSQQPQRLSSGVGGSGPAVSGSRGIAAEHRVVTSGGGPPFSRGPVERQTSLSRGARMAQGDGPSSSQQFSVGAAGLVNAPAPPRNRSASRVLQHHTDDLHPILRLGWQPLCEVHCNGLVGEFLGGHDRDLYIRVTTGDYASMPLVDVSQGGCIMTCSQFEKAAGRELSKKWKESIHVVGEGEGSKATLVSWLKRRADALYGPEVVGGNVWICVCADAEYYLASIMSYSKENGKHKVRYSDGFVEELHLPAEKLSFDEAKPAGPITRNTGYGSRILEQPAAAPAAPAATASNAHGGRAASGGEGPAAPGTAAGPASRKPVGFGATPNAAIHHQGSGISVTSMYDESGGGSAAGARERARDRRMRRQQQQAGIGGWGAAAGALLHREATEGAEGRGVPGSIGPNSKGQLRRRVRSIAEHEEYEAGAEDAVEPGPQGMGAEVGQGTAAAGPGAAAAASPREDGSGSQDDSASPTLTPSAKRMRTMDTAAASGRGLARTQSASAPGLAAAAAAIATASAAASGKGPNGRTLLHTTSLPASFHGAGAGQRGRPPQPPLLQQQWPLHGPAPSTHMPPSASPALPPAGPPAAAPGAMASPGPVCLPGPRIPPPPPSGFDETNVRAISRWMNSVVLALDDSLRAALAGLLGAGDAAPGMEARLSPSGRFQTLLVYARKSNCIHGYYEAMLTRYEAFRPQPRLLQRKIEEFVLAALYEDGRQHERELAILAQDRKQPDQEEVADQFGEP